MKTTARGSVTSGRGSIKRRRVPLGGLSLTHTTASPQSSLKIAALLRDEGSSSEVCGRTRERVYARRGFTDTGAYVVVYMQRGPPATNATVGASERRFWQGPSKLNRAGS
ncbi:hypothetical protein MRX96_022013 [Rhipicephalus microplus]